METLIKCKACGTDIAKSAKVCPKCGKKQGKKKAWIVIGIILLVIGFIWAVSNGAEGSSASSDSKKEYQVGEVFTVKNLEVSIIKVQKRNSVGNNFLSQNASEGGVFLAVQYQYKNIGKEPISIWSTPSLHLIDPEGVKYDSDSGASTYYKTEIDTNSKVLSDLNPGIQVKDADVFEVAKDKIIQPGWKLQIEDVQIPFTVK